MRALPLLVFPLLVAVGCGRASDGAEDMGVQSMKAPMAGDAATAAIAAAAPVAQEGMALASQETPTVPRLVVRNAELSLRVKDIEEAERKVGGVARSMGGLLEASQGSDLAGPNPTLSLTLRVPEGRFEETLASLEKLGTRLGKTVSTEDVTSQAVDMDARTKSLRVEEEAYRAILAGARRVSDVLEIQEKLTGVRTQIEQIVAQRRDLGDQAARSKIVVSLNQTLAPTAPPPDPDWMAQTWGDATGTLRGIGRWLASTALWLVALLPVWLPLGLLTVFFARRVRSIRA